MYVGVIRGDLPGALFLADLEPTSQTNFPIDPKGQTVYLARPNPTALTNFLGGLDPNEDPPKYQGSGGVPAGVIGTAAVTFPVTLTGSNNVLKVQTTPGSTYTSVTIPTGAYSTMTNLLAVVNKALAGTGAQATTDSATGTFFILESTALGVGASIGYDSTAAGSSFNTPMNLVAESANGTAASVTSFSTPHATITGLTGMTAAMVGQTITFSGAASGGNNGTFTIATFVSATSVTITNAAAVAGDANNGAIVWAVNMGSTFTMPTAATAIAAMLPVGGPLNVGSANVLTYFGASPAAASAVEVIAPQFVETDVAIQSFQVGNMAALLSATYNPDSRLLPALPNGPAITVVQNDGSTLFTAPLPQINSAVHNSPNTGDITISGVGLGNSEQNLTVVDVWNPTTNVRVRLPQALITSALGDEVALTGTFNVTAGSATVTASLSQSGLLLVGQSILFASQPKVAYEVVSVATTTITLSTVYNGVSNASTTASVDKTQGVVSSTSIVIPAVLLNPTPKLQTGEIIVPTPPTIPELGVVGSLVELRNGSLANVNSGTGANITSVVGGVVTLTGLARMNTYAVGNRIRITAATNAANLGTFFIASYISATSVTIVNINGVVESGAIAWNQIHPVVYVVT